MFLPKSKTTSQTRANTLSFITAQQLTAAQGTLSHIVGLTYPTGPALNHPAADMLLQFGTTGCPVDCGQPWTRSQLEAAIQYAAHPSAKDTTAA